MAQVLFATDTTCALADLDANFNEIYRFRELVSTPAHGAFSAYTASNEKGAIDATSFSWNWKVGDIKNSGTGSIVVTGSGKVGYDTGSGGSVTQATSKSTGVTLNKAVGTITMNAASLSAGASVTFLLTNSFIGANDVVVLHSNGPSSGVYQAWVPYRVAGFCEITLKNNSGGALAEAVTISFAVIKGVAA